MSSEGQSVLLDGVGKLVGSQVFTRLATFGLNQIVTKALSVEAYGLLSIRFHLINTSILTLSREGLRRGCLRSQQDSIKSVNAAAVLRLSSLSIPLGATVTVFGCWFFGPGTEDESIPGYQLAIIIQGAAAMLELVSEPLYILAQARMRIGLRVVIEAAATVAKIAATLLLLWQQGLAEAVALSIAQLIFAAVVLLGYVWHFLPELRIWVRPSSNAGSTVHTPDSLAKEGTDFAADQHPAAAPHPTTRWLDAQDLALCCSFTGQAFEKLLLAEGTKIAMTKVQSAYDQGVYGLVVNLGSIAVRTLFQPFEEAAFMAFSQPLPPKTRHLQRLQMLLPLVRIAVLVGLVATAFGPSNTFLLLHLLYGAKYSATEAPTALALYCPYILLLAANGILESFVHAASRGRELLQGHVALVVITLLQTGFTLFLVHSHGTLGMITADAVGMALRIAYCVWFVCMYAARISGARNSNSKPGVESASGVGLKSGANPDSWERAAPLREDGNSEAPTKAEGGLLQLWTMVPNVASLIVLISAALLSAVSAAACFGQGFLAGVFRQRQLGFWEAAVLHVLFQGCLLLGVTAVVLRAERSLWFALKQLRQKQA